MKDIYTNLLRLALAAGLTQRELFIEKVSAFLSEKNGQQPPKTAKESPQGSSRWPNRSRTNSSCAKFSPRNPEAVPIRTAPWPAGSKN